MSETANELFDAGLERYNAGEGPDTLIPVFKDVCDRAPKLAAAWSCLAWLYLLENKSEQAHKFALKGFKLDPAAPQGRVNLVLTMLETGQKGIREHIEVIKQMIAQSSEIQQEVTASIEDGLTRKPDWKSLNRVKTWLAED